MLGKSILVLLGSFWLSCGSSSQQQTSTQTNDTKAKAEKVVRTPEAIILVDTLDKEVAIISEEITQKVDTTSILSKKPKDLDPQIETPRKSEIVEKLKIRNHSDWNSLLAKHVSDNGDVDYKKFLENKSQLQDYLDYLADHSPEAKWSKNEKLAYYINLYNAGTVLLILNNYPTNSIKDIKNPWGKAWIKTGDGILSLGDIEHKILRKMDEPRIHFAINCASFSCPKLLNKAFTAEQMENQLQEATASFINDTAQNKISEEKLELSNIFKWYKKDFIQKSSLVEYINVYTQIKIKTEAKINYSKYNWSLNEAK